MKASHVIGIVAILAVLALCNLGGCPQTGGLFDAGGLAALSNGLNGQWKLTFVDGGYTCLTISGDQITTVDDGCMGDFFTVRNSQKAVKTGDRYLFNVDTSYEGTFFRFTFDITRQDDGTATGTLTVTNPNLGSEARDFVGVRQ